MSGRGKLPTLPMECNTCFLLQMAVQGCYVHCSEKSMCRVKGTTGAGIQSIIEHPDSEPKANERNTS